MADLIIQRLKIHIYNGDRWFNVNKDRYIENGETEERTSWKFTGGPMENLSGGAVPARPY